MNEVRQEKELMLGEVQKWLRESPYVIFIDYTGLKVGPFSELRNRLDSTQAKVHVIKNTFLRKAFERENLPVEGLHFSGQTAVVYGKADVAGTAKVLKNFETEFKLPKVRAAVIDRVAVDSKQVMTLADLPSREVLRSQFLGLLKMPATTLARLLQTPATQLVQVMQAHCEKAEKAS